MQTQKIQFTKHDDYRENYANSIQLRANLWDFFLSFGLIDQKGPDEVCIESFQGIYLSPQQAKALYNLLQQNIHQYEQAFGEIRLEPQGDNGLAMTTPVN
jgi:flagellar protein FlaG